jgi:lipid A 3-O-deacylase
LNWDFQLPADFEFSFKLGAMVHNGEVSPGGFPDRKELGCRVLFHTGGGLGYRLENDVLLQFYMDHSSNGRICDTNEGLDNVGLRVGVPL